jgi:PPP family 3-phenylpropionic acid transporter
MRWIEQKNNLYFIALQSLFWSAQCLITAFFTMYMKSLGYENDQIGIVVAIGSLTLMAGHYFWGSFCYRTAWLSHKNIIIFCFSLGIILNVVFYFSAEHLWVLIICFACMMFTFLPMSSMIDAWTYFRKNDDPTIQFGLTRGFGSFSYSSVALLFGMIIPFTGMNSIFLFSSLFLVLAIGLTSFIDRGSPTESNRMAQIAGIFASKELFRNAKYVLLLISAFSIYLAANINHYFYSLLILELGGSSREVGYGMFIAAFSEMFVLFTSIWWIRKFRADRLLLIAFGFTFLKSILFAFSDSLPMAIFAQLTHAIAFGLYTPSLLAYLVEIVKKSEHTVALMVISSICSGFGGFIGSIFGGVVSQHFGLSTLFGFCSLFSIVGILTFLFSIIWVKTSKSTLESY